MTGRPSVLAEEHCSVPLPVSFSEQSLEDVNLVNDLRRSSVASTASFVSHNHLFVGSRSLSDTDSGKTSPPHGVAEANEDSYFKAAVQLCIVTQRITESLYTVGTKIRSHNDLHQDIIQLGRRLDDWLMKLPRHLHFQTHPHGSTTSQDPFLRERTMLAFQFCSAKILLTRPCLSSFTVSAKHAEETAIPVDFTQRMAGVCVETAKTVVGLLPDQPQPHFLYEFGPWWTAVHSLMQALAVLLLALSCSSEAQQHSVVLAGYCLKIVRWLHCLDDPLADRACRVAVHCLGVITHRLSLPLPNELFMGIALPISSTKYDLKP